MAHIGMSPHLEAYLDLVADFIQHCHKLSRIKGYSKLEKKCRSELKFLKSLHLKNSTVQENHLRSSNLNHYAGILYMSECLPDVTSILQPFSVQSRITGSLVVDVVCGHGLAWIKVIARKAQALHLVWAGRTPVRTKTPALIWVIPLFMNNIGQGQFGDRDLMSQAYDYLNCASQHPVNYIVPKVHFVFFNAITEPMAQTLKELGIQVWGEFVPVEPDTQIKLQSVQELFGDSSESDDCETLSDKDDEEDEDKKEVASAEDQTAASLHKTPAPSSVFLPSSEIPASEIDKQLLQVEQNVSATIGKYMEHLKDISKNELRKCESVNDDSKHMALPFAVQMYFNSQKLPKAPIPVALKAEVENPQNDEPVSHITRLNLDITTLITLVSAVSHGHCNFVFPEKILTMQATEERESPVLPRLLNFMEGKTLYSCQTAVSDFQTILDTLGGKSERARAKELLSRIEIVPDQPSERSRALPVTGKLKERSKIIFGTGDNLQAITMTANSGYVRAAENHGVSFAIFLHASRALTEMKERTATILEQKSAEEKTEVS